MVERIRRLRVIALAGIGVLSVGRVLDLRWHVTHNEFETGSDQIQAHWLAWLGALIMLCVAVIAVRRPVYRSPGFGVLLGSAVLYIAVAVWHFWLHQQLRDPDLPHVLLALSQAGLYIGGAMVAAGLLVPHCRDKYIVGHPRHRGAETGPLATGRSD